MQYANCMLTDMQIAEPNERSHITLAKLHGFVTQLGYSKNFKWYLFFFWTLNIKELRRVDINLTAITDSFPPSETEK